MVEVIQADREAAALLAEWHTGAASQWEIVSGGTMQWFTNDFPEACRKGVWDGHEFVQAFARHRIEAAAQARREAIKEAARACEDQMQVFLSPEYATGQPLSSFHERFACGQCAAAIRSLSPESKGD